MPSRSFRNNNPGNIRFGKFAAVRGAVDDGEGYARWTVAIRGTAAMLELLALPSYRDLTLLEAITRYAPAADRNKPREYAAYVAHRAGVSQDMKLADMDPFQVLRVVEAMVRFEGWKA